MRMFWLGILPLALHAEFLEVKMQVEKMDCATCVQSMEIGLRKTRGITRVEVDPIFGVNFVLAKGNKITLEQLRDSIKRVGFAPYTAKVTVRGKPVTSEGRWRFEVDGIQKIYMLSSSSDTVILELQKHNGALVTIQAESPAPPDPRTVPGLEVVAIVPESR